MTPDLWKQIQLLFDRALELSEDERNSFLVIACGDDEALKSEVESLLKVVGESGTFIEESLRTADAARRREPTTYRLVLKIAKGVTGRIHLSELHNDEFRMPVA